MSQDGHFGIFNMGLAEAELKTTCRVLSAFSFAVGCFVRAAAPRAVVHHKELVRIYTREESVPAEGMGTKHF